MFKAKQIPQLLALPLVLAMAVGCSGSDNESTDPLAGEPPAPRSEAVLVLTDANGRPITAAGTFRSTDEDFAGVSPLSFPAGGVINIPVSPDALDRVGAGQAVVLKGRVDIPGFLVTPVSIDIDDVAEISGTAVADLVATVGGDKLEGVEIAEIAGDATAGPITVPVIEEDERTENDVGNRPVQRTVVAVNQVAASDLGSGENALSGVDDSGNTVTLSLVDLSSLAIEVAHFDAETPASLDTLPGGFEVSILPPNAADYTDDEPAATRLNADEAAILGAEQIIFQSAGFISVNAVATDSNGNPIEVRDLGPNKLVNIRIDIPATVINAETGNPVAVDDTVPVWSLDNDATQWRYEGRTTIQQDATGFFAEFQPTHLSYYNMAWYRSANCDASFTLVDEDNVAGGAVDFRYFTRLSGTGYSKSKGPNRAGETLTLRNVPDFDDGLTVQFSTAKKSGILEVTDITRINSSESVTFGLDSDGRVTGFNPCAGANKSYQVSIRRDLPPQQVRVDVEVNAVTFCQQDPTVTAPYRNAYNYVYAVRGGTVFDFVGSRRTNGQGVSRYNNVEVVPGQDSIQATVEDRSPQPGQPASRTITLPVASGVTTYSPVFRFRRDCPELDPDTTGGSGGS